jgi:hypothetical protein
MKKIITIGFVAAVAVGLVMASGLAWSRGRLFLRQPAQISLNGIDSSRSEVYKSGNGDYFIFLEKTEGEVKTFWIGHGKVGVPSDIVPSMSTLSIRTGSLLICLDAEIDTLGEMSWEGVNPKLSISDEQISFQVGSDNIAVNLKPEA